MASFETLYITFKAETDQLKKELDDVKKRLNETTEGFQKTEVQTKKSDSSFGSLAKNVALLAASYISLSSASRIFSLSMQNIEKVGDLSRSLNIPVEKVDAWRKTFTSLGADANTVFQEIGSLAEQFNTSPERALDILVNTIPAQAKKLGPVGAQLYLQERFNLSPQTISLVLRETSKSLNEEEKKQEALGVVSKEEEQLMRDYRKATVNLGFALDRVARVVLEDLLPPTIKVAEALTDLINFFYIRGFNEEAVNDYIFTPEEQTARRADKAEADRVWKELKRGFGIQTESSFFIMPETPFISPRLAPMSNSQSNTGYFDININTTAQDVKGIGNEIMSRLKDDWQLWQSNSQVDDAVVI